MPGPKTKSKLTLSLPEAIINLKNDNTKPYKIAECLSSVFSRTIKSKYVSMVICKHNKRLQLNVFALDRRRNKKMSDTALHLIKRLNDLSNGLITGKQLQKKLKDYLNLEVSVSRCLYYRHKIIGTNFRRSRFQPKIFNQFEKDLKHFTLIKKNTCGNNTSTNLN